MGELLTLVGTVRPAVHAAHRRCRHPPSSAPVARRAMGWQSRLTVRPQPQLSVVLRWCAYRWVEVVTGSGCSSPGEATPMRYSRTHERAFSPSIPFGHR
jgi:hypothetical protein